MKTFRFCIRSEDGRVSKIWRSWVQGDEVYLMERSTIGGRHKFSFHSSGICRWARIQPGVSGSDRKFHEWLRPPVPEANTENASLLLRMGIPANHLSVERASADCEIQWLTSGKDRQARGFEFMLSADSPTIFQDICAKTHRDFLFGSKLRDGTFFYCISHIFDCGEVNLRSPGDPVLSGQVFGDVEFPDRDLTNSGRPIRMLLASHEESTPFLWELGGYQSRNIQEISCSKVLAS